jgi:hypothetical protein
LLFSLYFPRHDAWTPGQLTALLSLP